MFWCYRDTCRIYWNFQQWTELSFRWMFGKLFPKLLGSHNKCKHLRCVRSAYRWSLLRVNIRSYGRWAFSSAFSCPFARGFSGLICSLFEKLSIWKDCKIKSHLWPLLLFEPLYLIKESWMLRKLVVQDLGWENWSRIASKQWLLSNLIIHLCLRKFYGLFARTKSWSHFYQCWLL